MDDEARDAAIADHEVRAAPEDEPRQPARPCEPNEGPELEGVVGGDEQVRRPADAHRRLARERLVTDGLDPDPPGDVPGERRRVEGAGRGQLATRPRARASISA